MCCPPSATEKFQLLSPRATSNALWTPQRADFLKASAAEKLNLGHPAQITPPMRLFLKLFEPFLQWFYHCFDRIVINGYLSFLTREANVVYFFRDVRGEPVLTKELLRQRTKDYQCWVENYALKNCIPILWAEKGVRFVSSSARMVTAGGVISPTGYASSGI